MSTGPVENTDSPVTQRLHFITLATPDLAATRRFYRDGLGWTPLADVPDEIIFFQVGPGLVLGLFDAREFGRDLEDPTADDHPDATTTAPAGVSGVTLSHNVDSPDAVDTVVAIAVDAGATLVKSPQRAAFGGYHGHFADPNGVLWEICHNPSWSVDETGLVHLSPVD